MQMTPPDFEQHELLLRGEALRDWQYRSANWAGLVGAFHVIISLLWGAGLAIDREYRDVIYPSLLLLAPAALHLIAAAGISRSLRWGWVIEAWFAPVHAVAIVVALAWLGRDTVEPLLFVTALGTIPIAPMLWLMFCLYRCRELDWSGDADDEAPAFPVIAYHPARGHAAGESDEQR